MTTEKNLKNIQIKFLINKYLLNLGMEKNLYSQNFILNIIFKNKKKDEYLKER